MGRSLAAIVFEAQILQFARLHDCYLMQNCPGPVIFLRAGANAAAIGSSTLLRVPESSSQFILTLFK